jgi:hypothetical protein
MISGSLNKQNKTQGLCILHANTLSGSVKQAKQYANTGHAETECR